MKNTEKLNEIFDIEPMSEEIGETLPEVISTTKSEDTEDDYQLARATLRNMISKGTKTLDALMDLAKNSETPRSYEVAGQFIKTMSDVSKDLLDIQKQVKDLNQEDATGPIRTQNNIVFAGSTNDLMKFIKNNNDNDRIIDQ